MSAHTKKAIPGYAGYFVDETGIVYSSAKWRGQVGLRALAVEDNRRGYLRVRMVCPDGKRRIVCVHKLMALVFLPAKPSPAHEIRHINGDSHDNKATNLKWGTRKENAMDREAHGRTSRGKTHGVAISEGLAQARLIAAAPRMFQWLKALTALPGFEPNEPYGVEARAILRDVEGSNG